MDSEKQLENIVIRCKGGERRAFEQLFELYQPRLKYYIRRLDDSGSETEDILQDIWMTVFRKIRAEYPDTPVALMSGVAEPE